MALISASIDYWPCATLVISTWTRVAPSLFVLEISGTLFNESVPCCPLNNQRRQLRLRGLHVSKSVIQSASAYWDSKPNCVVCFSCRWGLPESLPRRLRHQQVKNAAHPPHPPRSGTQFLGLLLWNSQLARQGLPIGKNGKLKPLALFIYLCGTQAVGVSDICLWRALFFTEICPTPTNEFAGFLSLEKICWVLVQNCNVLWRKFAFFA